MLYTYQGLYKVSTMAGWKTAQGWCEEHRKPFAENRIYSLMREAGERLFSTPPIETQKI